MKLSRFLALITTVLWVLVFIGTLAIIITNTKQYLTDQMKSHSQDSATFLGLSLTASVQAKDDVLMSRMVDAVFDSGYYRQIIVRGVDGAVLVDRTQGDEVKDVPDWFVATLPLDTPEGQAFVTDGWQQVATINIASHPGHAYREFWRVTTQAFWLMLTISLFSLAFMLLTLRFALAPLQDMVALANDIAQRRFNTLKKMPWAIELRQVAQAMNSMSPRIGQMLEEQSELAENLRKKAYEDEVTGLQNRRNFVERLSHLARAPEELSGGVIALIHINGFSEYNTKQGRKAADALLTACTRSLHKVSAQQEGSLLARTSGSEFAILAEGVDPAEADAFGQTIINALTPVMAEYFDEASPLRVSVGLARLDKKQNAGAWLSAADSAMRVAQNKDGHAWHSDSGEARETIARGEDQWRDLIADALNRGNILLHFQPVKAVAGGAIIHYEALARVTNTDGSLMPARLFLPTIKKSGLTELLDKQTVAKVLALQKSNDPRAQHPIAINLSAASMSNPSFIEWLREQFAASPRLAANFSIELSEQDLLAHADALETALPQITAIGLKIGIDRFGHTAEALKIMRRLQIAYIKIDGSYIRQIHENKDNQFIVQALVGIAHGLGTKVIAEYVEAAEEVRVLEEMNIDGAQGYLIGKPE